MDLKNQKGILKKWFGKHGFIRHHDRDVFVHANNYLAGFVPQIGQVVMFDFGLAPNNRPPMAVNVRVIKSAKAVREEQEIKEALAATQGGSHERPTA